MKPGVVVYVDGEGWGECWFVRPGGEIVVVFPERADKYRTFPSERVIECMARFEAAALKRGDRVSDVYGGVSRVEHVMELGTSPPSFLLVRDDGHSTVRVWRELVAVVYVPE